MGDLDNGANFIECLTSIILGNLPKIIIEANKLLVPGTEANLSGRSCGSLLQFKCSAAFAYPSNLLGGTVVMIENSGDWWSVWEMQIWSPINDQTSYISLLK